MRTALLVALLALALVGAGCTGDDAADTTATTGIAATSTSTTTTTTLLPATTSSTLPPLVEAYGGGFGFRLGAADQTVGLFVTLADLQDFYEGVVPEVSVLPNAMWEAELRFGARLFANWGNDTASDPEPVVDEVWRIVAGTITILELPGTEACGLARARFEGFEAEAPDGTRTRLGSFEVETTAWGCLPG